MADIAEIGFRANTGELADAKLKMEQLVPAAGKAERAANRLNSMMEAGSRAAVAAARADVQKANAVLSAAKASETATKSEIAAAAAAKRKAQATYDAAKAAQTASAASKAAAAAAKQEAAAFEQAATAKKRYTSVPSVGSRHDTPATGMGPWGPRGGTANDNDPLAQSAGAMKANVGNIAAQFQDIGVTAAMGMNPLLIALQQGTQLSMAMEGGVKSLGAALMTVLSPTALLTIAVVALVAAGLQMINWTSLAQSALNLMAQYLPQVATGITLVGAALAIAFAPAILTVFWNLFLTVAAGIVGAVGMIVASVGAIPIAIGLIIADLYIFRDEWAQVLGFDVIDVAKNAANLIIGSFVAAYHDIEFIWQNFPNVIGAAAVGAANMAIKAVNAIVSASVSAINKLIAMVDKLGGSSIMQTLGMGFEIGQFADGAGEFPLLANEAADALAGAVKDRNVQLQEDLTKDYIGAMGGAITAGAKWASDKLKTFSAGLGGDAGGKKKGAGGGGKTEGEKFEDIVRGAERTIATLQAEKDALGQSAEATARLKYETELLNKAQQANINLTPQQRDQLMQLAGQMATLEIETARVKEAMDFSKDLTKGFLNDFIQGVKNGESVWKSFGQAALGVLDKIGQKLVDMAVDSMFSGGGGFLSSIFGGLFGGFFPSAPGVGLYANGGAFAQGISGHSNTVVDRPTLFAFASGAGLMGEAGPEAIMPLKRGPDGSLGVQMHNSSSGKNGPVSNSVVIENHYTLEGVISEQAMVQRIQQTAEKTQQEVKKNMVGWLNQYSEDGAFA